MCVCVCVCMALPPLVAVLESQTWLPCMKGPSPQVAAKFRDVCVGVCACMFFCVCVCAHTCVCVLLHSGAGQKPELGFHLQLPFHSNTETQPSHFLKYLKESLLNFEFLRVSVSLTRQPCLK